MGIPGELGVFKTPNDRLYSYFSSGDLSSTRAVIFIGGLFNGMGDVPYLPTLSSCLGSAGWKLVQMHWTSAYDGFGTSSLFTDVEEMAALASHLRAEGTTKVVVMGHSTGSQDVIHYLTTRDDVDGGIMQAPVSDREHFFATDEFEYKEWRDALPYAEELVNSSRGAEILPGRIGLLGLRMSAYRLHSLLSISGDDDYFSSDLPNMPDRVAKHPLSTSFGKLSAPALVVFSEKDQFAHVPDIDAHLKRWTEAAHGRLTTVTIKGANHAVDDAAHHPTLGKEVVEWLQRTFD